MKAGAFFRPAERRRAVMRRRGKKHLTEGKKMW